MKKWFVFLVFIQLYFWVIGQKQLEYKTPPKEIVDLLMAPGPPQVFIHPSGEWLLQAFNPDYISINSLVDSEYKLAGIRFNPSIYGSSRENYFDSISLINISSAKDFEISNLPEKGKFRHFVWSPDGNYIAFSNQALHGFELWVINVERKTAEKLSDNFINAVLPQIPIIWADEGNSIIYTSVIADREAPSENVNVPIGPVIRESNGTESAVTTYQDLLQNGHDEDLFEFYATSQLIKISVNRVQYPIGIPGIFNKFLISPDKQYLLVETIQKPYSFFAPYHRFTIKIEIWDNEGNLFRELFKIPVAENIPIGFDAVRKGPREIDWRTDKPCSLYWVQTLDGGDPDNNVLTRDRLFLFDFPFDGKGVESIGLANRFEKVLWGTDRFAIVVERWWDTRNRAYYSFDPNKDNKELLFSFNWQDEYNHPGDFISQMGAMGKQILQFDAKGEQLFLKGKGATPEGYKPFIDGFDPVSGKKERLWQSTDPYYEIPLSFIDVKKYTLLTCRESKTDPPNYFERNLKNGVVSQITNYLNPYPQLATVRSELLKYSRSDGIVLTGRFYTPPGFKTGDSMLPVFMWTYPNEFKTTESANQVKDSPNRFPILNAASPVFWVTMGYGVFDGPSMPIVGEPEPNDNFVEQLVENAKAAVKCLDSLGVVDLKKIAIGGHGYGAFMAANLLAHTDLFCAGIARSGAYNLTLAPFGFQSEERTFWEAKDTYIEMSPLTFANKIKEPVLLIHGEADNNSDTFPLQSERMFAALKGNGVNARLVVLPFESHYYQAKESIFHAFWETNQWFEKYLKQSGK